MDEPEAVFAQRFDPAPPAEDPTPRIRTTADEYPEIALAGELALRPVIAVDVERMKAGLPAGAQPTGDVSREQPLAAYVNQGRWVAECPACASGLVVAPDDPRFFCVECRNAYIGHAWRRVTFPDAKRRASIEKVLLARPNELHRSWVTEESVDDLRAENENPMVVAGKNTVAQFTTQEILAGRMAPPGLP